MTVTYKHTSGDTVICHGLGHAGEDGYYTGPLGQTDESSVEWAAEYGKPIGAASAEPYDRGCGEHAFALRVERRFTAEDLARLFVLSHAGTLPRLGVSLEVQDEDAGKLVTFASAVLQKLSFSRVGCSVDIFYVFLTSVPVVTDIPEPT